MVLIAGGTASGKTTLARNLVDRTGALLITHDRYYCDIPHPRGFNFDHPDALDTALLEDHLEMIVRGETAELPVYDFASHSRASHTEPAQHDGLVVIEGILVLTSERLARSADLIVYVDAPDDIRLARRIRRDLSERGRTVESVLDQYMKTVRPMHESYVVCGRERAQLVLDGTSEPESMLKDLIGEMSATGWNNLKRDQRV